MVNENETVTGSFKIPDDAVIHFSDNLGKIVNVDYDTKTFKYMAPSIKGDQDETDTIQAYTAESGKTTSDITTVKIVIKHVKMKSDNAVVNNDLKSNSDKKDDKNIDYSK